MAIKQDLSASVNDNNGLKKAGYNTYTVWSQIF